MAPSLTASERAVAWDITRATGVRVGWAFRTPSEYTVWGDPGDLDQVLPHLLALRLSVQADAVVRERGKPVRYVYLRATEDGMRDAARIFPLEVWIPALGGTRLRVYQGSDHDEARTVAERQAAGGVRPEEVDIIDHDEETFYTLQDVWDEESRRTTLRTPDQDEVWPDWREWLGDDEVYDRENPPEPPDEALWP